MKRYKEMRAALMDAGAIDRTTCEIVVTSQLALLGYEVPFKFHAIKLFELKVSKEQLQQVILAGVGVTFLVVQASRVLDWIDEAHSMFVAK